MRRALLVLLAAIAVPVSASSSATATAMASARIVSAATTVRTVATTPQQVQFDVDTRGHEVSASVVASEGMVIKGMERFGVLLSVKRSSAPSRPVEITIHHR